MPETSIEALCSSLLYLLSRQAQSPETRLQRSISDHFHWISTHPNIRIFPVLEQTAARLAANWESHQSQNLTLIQTSIKHH